MVWRRRRGRGWRLGSGDEESGGNGSVGVRERSICRWLRERDDEMGLVTLRIC